MPINQKLLEQQLKHHCEDNEKQFVKIESSIGHVKDAVNNMRDNHLQHLDQKLSKVETDVSWLKKFFWIVASSSIGGLLAGLINLIK